MTANKPDDMPRPFPGDQAQPGTQGAGENICPECKGSGKLGPEDCRACGGTGVVIEGIGGG